jgi:hypothetical protein
MRPTAQGQEDFFKSFISSARLWELQLPKLNRSFLHVPGPITDLHLYYLFGIRILLHLREG